MQSPPAGIEHDEVLRAAARNRKEFRCDRGKRSVFRALAAQQRKNPKAREHPESFHRRIATRYDGLGQDWLTAGWRQAGGWESCESGPVSPAFESIIP